MLRCVSFLYISRDTRKEESKQFSNMFNNLTWRSLWESFLLYSLMLYIYQTFKTWNRGQRPRLWLSVIFLNSPCPYSEAGVHYNGAHTDLLSSTTKPDAGTALITPGWKCSFHFQKWVFVNFQEQCKWDSSARVLSPSQVGAGRADSLLCFGSSTGEALNWQGMRQQGHVHDMW